MHLLLVEDEKQIAKYLVKGLQRNGFAVDHVLTGKEALSILAVNTFDCLLLDLNLPDMDGLDIARKLRDDGSQLPILMLTARNEHEDILRGFKSGTLMTTYLSLSILKNSYAGYRPSSSVITRTVIVS
jgi:DNA-binding response OmpR family regulator